MYSKQTRFSNHRTVPGYNVTIQFIKEMSRTKQRSLNLYKGRRRGHRAVKVKDVFLMGERLSHVTETTPDSASVRKMELFRIKIGELSDKDYYALIQSSCLANLVKHFCNMPNRTACCKF